jgi:diguanylate cyclase (GGDEF)-like protein
MVIKSIPAERQDQKSLAMQATKPRTDVTIVNSCSVNEKTARSVTQETRQPIRLATCDSLTRLYNRQAILGNLRELVSLANSSKENFSLIMLHIDGLRKVNESYGRLTGDEVLDRIAVLIRCNTRDTDVAGRYGEDEFIIILPKTDLASSWVAAERLRSIIEKTQFKDSAGNMFAVTVSQGLVGWERNDDAASLISRADMALRKAQQKGRNRIQILLGASLRDEA